MFIGTTLELCTDTRIVLCKSVNIIRKFIICSSSLRRHDNNILPLFALFVQQWPGNLRIKYTPHVQTSRGRVTILFVVNPKLFGRWQRDAVITFAATAPHYIWNKSKITVCHYDSSRNTYIIMLQQLYVICKLKQ